MASMYLKKQNEEKTSFAIYNGNGATNYCPSVFSEHNACHEKKNVDFPELLQRGNEGF